MKKEIQNCLAWLANRVSEIIVYKNWDKESKEKEIEKTINIFYTELKKQINFTKLTVEEAKQLRFHRWSEEQTNLWLFPLYLTPIIPEELEVISISGNRYKYEKDKADNDTRDIRRGCVSYGIEIKE